MVFAPYNALRKREDENVMIPIPRTRTISPALRNAPGRRRHEARQPIQREPPNNAPRETVRLVREHSPHTIGMSIGTRRRREFEQLESLGAPVANDGDSC